MNHSAPKLPAYHHRSLSRERLGRRQRYTAAKQLAINLLQQAEYYAAQSSSEAYEQMVNKINKLITSCSDEQKGQILLIVCRSTVQLGLSMSNLPVPSDYFQLILKYIDSLLVSEDRKQQSSSRFVKQVYSGRKIVKRELQVVDGRNTLFEMFLIDRLDIFLKLMAYELRSENRPTVQLSAELSRFMLDTASRLAILPEQDQQEFKSNVEWIILLSSAKPESVITKRTIDDYSLLDQYFDPQGHSVNNKELNKSSTVRRQTSKRQLLKIAPSLEGTQNAGNTLRREGKLDAESTLMFRKIKRGSIISSSHGKRTSYKSTKKDETPARVSTRWTNKLSINEVITNSNRPARRSNFLQIRPKQLQNMCREVYTNTHQNPIIVEQLTMEMDRQNNECTNKSITTESHVDRDQINPFYLFVKIKKAVFLITVQEILDAFDNQDRKQLKFSIGQSSFMLHRPIDFKPTAQENDLLQDTYQTQISSMIGFYRDEYMGLRIKIQQDQYHGNVLRVTQPQHSLLMGFIRKVSTYFIYIVKFYKKTKYPIFEQGLMRKMFEGGILHGVSVNAACKLMNADLSIVFQQQQKLDIERGSLFSYIQNEEYKQNVVCLRQEYNLTVQNHSMKSSGQVRIKQIWKCSKYKKAIESRKRNVRKTNSTEKICRIPSEFVFEQKKLKKTAINKNSIRIDASDFESILSQVQFSKQSFAKTASKIDLTNFTSKKHYNVQASQKYQANNLKIRKKVVKDSRETHFIQTLKTDKGYKLVKRTCREQIGRQSYEDYYGYLQNNPQNCAYIKQKTEISDRGGQHYLKSKMSLHGHQNFKNDIEDVCLISFVKRLKIDQVFSGYLISSIRLFTSQQNGWIFIETYWQRMSKYYIFTVSSEIFQKLTEINTSSFKEKPFSAEMTSLKKNRQKRTSMFATLMKSQAQSLNSSKLKKIRHPPIEELEEGMESANSRAYPRSKITEGRGLTTNMMPTINKGIKTNDNCSTIKNMKNSQKNILKRQVLTRLKSRIVRSSAFSWRRHTLYLQIKYSCSSQLEASSRTLQLQGSELAVKNVYEDPLCPTKAAATELILVRYQQSNMANINVYNIQALNKISFEHIFIKSKGDLYGKYISSIKLTDILPEQRTHHHIYNLILDSFIRTTNSYYKTAERLFSKTSFRQQQRKFSYQQLITLAKSCCLPYEAIQQRKKKTRDTRFLIPNRNRYLMCNELVYEVLIKESQIKLKTLGGQIIQTLPMKRLECFFPYVRKLGPRQIKTLLVRRILQDEDLIRMCFTTTSK